ncbi:MAG: pilus assembly protein N-terminal domain-containing protein [Thermodesulfobacteriota bacterium]
MKRAFVVIIGLLLALGTSLAQAADIVNLAVNESYVLNTSLKVSRVQIGSPQVATVKVLNSRELMINAKGVGETEVRIWDKEKQERVVRIRVGVNALATKQVREIIRQIDPSGNIGFTLTPQRLLLTGKVPNASRGERLEKILEELDYNVVNLLTVTGQQQVQLLVRVAEVIKGNPMRAGLAVQDKRDRGGIFPPGNLGTGSGFLINVDEIVSGVISAVNPGITRGLMFPHTDAFQLGFNPRGTDFYGVLSLMEGHNLARVLAQPTLVVESGKSASFVAGGEVPVPVAQESDTVSVEWKEFGVILDFAPVILEDGLIGITLKQEVSAIDWTNGITVGSLVMPGFKTRNTETSIKLHDGESFLVSGLLSDHIRSAVSKVPLLGDLPILGALFRSSTYDKDQSELAVVVTAKIVNPIPAGTEIRLPGADITAPGFWSAFLLGSKSKAQNPDDAVLSLLSDAGLETP